MTALGRAGNGGLIVTADGMAVAHRELIIRLAARHKLPAVYSRRLFVTDGGLISYGADRVDLFRQAAAYVDRIFKGEKPGDLPVQAPTKYELVINLKTAKAIGLEGAADAARPRRRVYRIELFLLHCIYRLLALRDGRHFDGQPSLSEHCGHDWTCRLPGPVAISSE